MKILVLHHTAWIEMLIHNWQLLDGLEVLGLQLPVAQWDCLPDLQRNLAKTIVTAVDERKIDFVLDINGAGVLPLDEGLSSWTTTRVGAPWCEWWWDDPINYVHKKAAANQLDEWIDALSHRHVRHFIWDRTLAREYSTWFGRTWTHLPTATNVGFFHPDAAKLSIRNFPPLDIAFLGTFYLRPAVPADDQRRTEFDYLAARRVDAPDDSYFDLINGTGIRGRAPNFLVDFAAAQSTSHGFFAERLVDWKRGLNWEVGLRRRTMPLEELSPMFQAHFFAGENWPAFFDAEATMMFQPAELAALYQTTMFSLDLGNGQAFTGTAMRSYEIMACGGILSLRHLPDFDPAGELRDKVYITYASAKDLAIQREHYANNPRRLAEIRAAAREFAASRHSWLHRFPVIIEALSHA